MQVVPDSRNPTAAITAEDIYSNLYDSYFFRQLIIKIRLL